MTRSSLSFSLLSTLLPLLAGCGESTPNARLDSASRDAVVRVSDQSIPLGWVEEVARAQGGHADAVAVALADDLRLSLAARRAHLDDSAEGARGSKAALARSTLQKALERARATAPTDEEVGTLSKERWRDVEVPETRVVLHAVVLRPKKETPETLMHAKSLAATLLDRVARADSVSEFEALANGVPHDASELVVQPLPPFTADGRIVSEEGSLDLAFARGAFQIDSIGKTSAIVESSFGWHVIYLVEKRGPKIVPLDARRALFLGEVVNRRVRAEIQRIAGERSGKHPIEISSAAETILAEFHDGLRSR